MDSLVSHLSVIKPFCPIILFIIYLCIEFYRLGFKHAFKMNTKPLTEQYLFWATLRIPLVSFIWFGCFAWANIELSMDADGYNTFLSASKLPLGLLSLSIPLAVIVNNVHRTIQTNKQIEETEKKNKNDIFYSHQKFIIENINSIKTGEIDIKYPYGMFTFELKISKPFKLYKEIFPYSSINDNIFEVSNRFLGHTIEHWREILNNINQIKSDNSSIEEKLSSINEIENSLAKIRVHMGASTIGANTKFIAYRESKDFITALPSESAVKSFIDAHLKVYNEILDIINITMTADTFLKEILLFTQTEENYFPDYMNMGFSKKSDSYKVTFSIT